MHRHVRTYLTALFAMLLALPLLAVMAPAAQAQQDQSYFVLYGEPGEYITQGDDLFHAESANVEFTPSVNFDNGISVLINVFANDLLVEQWNTSFAAPDEAPLQAGDDNFWRPGSPSRKPATPGSQLAETGAAATRSLASLLFAN